MNIKTEKEDLIEELNRTNKLLEEASLNYLEMCKQVEKLEQENEELEKSVRKNKEKRKNATEKYQALKDYTNKQNFELVLENEGLQSLNDFNVQKIETLEAENEELENQVFNWEEINKLQEKYMQCLDEIEARVLNENADELLEWIVDKIKEVKNND